MKPWDWYLKVWRNYAQFDGRARRMEYWYFTLFNTLAALVLFLITLALFGKNSPPVLNWLYSLAAFIPSLAVSIRRLHDTGRSGWWVLVCFVPFIGGLVFLVFMVLDSEAGTNAYGPNPIANQPFRV